MIITDDQTPVEATDPRVLLAILAAGGGTRMRSKLAKPLHPVCGRSMLAHVVAAGMAVAPAETLIVAGAGSAASIAREVDDPATRVVVQPSPRGTADALRVALDASDGADLAISLFGDHPLLTGEVVKALLAGARAEGATVTILSCEVPDAAGYGRVARNDSGQVERIVERADDDPARRSGRTEINSGMMAVDAAWASAALRRIEPSGATGELYLTDLVAMAAAEHRLGQAWPVAAVRAPAEVALGINDRQQLREAEEILWERRRREVLASGVSLNGADTIFIEAGVEVGQDSVIEPFTILRAGTRIGTECRVGPHATLDQTVVGNRVTIRSSTLTRVRIHDDADVGPYAHLRPGTEIGPGAHVGNYAEIKNATIGAGAKVGHFSYVGDAAVGPHANIGAGVVTANFDGRSKHRTEIGDHAFVGSDTVLRAPVRVGRHAFTGAGSVVTKDVPDGATAVGVPARVIRRRSISEDDAAGGA